MHALGLQGWIGSEAWPAAGPLYGRVPYQQQEQHNVTAAKQSTGSLDTYRTQQGTSLLFSGSTRGSGRSGMIAEASSSGCSHALGLGLLQLAHTNNLRVDSTGTDCTCISMHLADQSAVSCRPTSEIFSSGVQHSPTACVCRLRCSFSLRSIVLLCRPQGGTPF